MTKHSDPERRHREAVEAAREVVGRRLVHLGRLHAYLKHKAAEAREDGSNDDYEEMVNNQAHALGWALPILRDQVEIEVAAAIEREESRKRWGVHYLPEAVPLDPDHARAIAHTRGLRVELEKMKLHMPTGDQTLADAYARFLDAVIAAVEEHAVGYYWDQVTTPPRMVLRNDGAIVLDTQR